MTAATLKAARKAAAVERAERALASIRPVAISPDLPDAPLVIAPPGSDLPGRGGACLTRLVTLARLGAIPSLYRVVAGSLLAWDATYGEWDTCWRMGHVWLWDAVAGRIVDPSMPDWPKALPRLRWQLHAPLERLTPAEGTAAALLELYALQQQEVA